jgi:hypothetical protein
MNIATLAQAAVLTISIRSRLVKRQMSNKGAKSIKQGRALKKKKEKKKKKSGLA